MERKGKPQLETKSVLLLLFFVCVTQVSGYSVGGLIPKAVHIALNGEYGFTVSWYTAATPPFASRPVCQVETPNAHPPVHEVTGYSYQYSSTAGGFEGCLHEVQMPRAKLRSRTVFYRCTVASPSTVAPWSRVFNVTLYGAGLPDANERDMAIVLFGDLGVKNSQDTMATIHEATHSGRYGNLAMMVHGGDIGYADNYFPSERNYHIWVEYMERMQSMAAHLPYMSIPGNHEAQFNFTAYVNWMRMPFRQAQSDSPFYYSFDYLGVHFTMFSTEHPFSPGTPQHEWLEADLVAANSNRDKVPWIIAMGHRPFYCSSVESESRCTKDGPKFRGYLEDIFFQTGVDVYISGHNHQYERSYPVFKENFLPNYKRRNLAFPVHIVNGAAGNLNPNDITHMEPERVPWRAAHGDGRTGFMVMKPTEHHLTFSYIASKGGEVIDHFVLTK